MKLKNLCLLTLALLVGSSNMQTQASLAELSARPMSYGLQTHTYLPQFLCSLWHHKLATFVVVGLCAIVVSAIWRNFKKVTVPAHQLGGRAHPQSHSPIPHQQPFGNAAQPPSQLQGQPCSLTADVPLSALSSQTPIIEPKNLALSSNVNSTAPTLFPPALHPTAEADAADKLWKEALDLKDAAALDAKLADIGNMFPTLGKQWYTDHVPALTELLKKFSGAEDTVKNSLSERLAFFKDPKVLDL